MSMQSPTSIGLVSSSDTVNFGIRGVCGLDEGYRGILPRPAPKLQETPHRGVGWELKRFAGDTLALVRAPLTVTFGNQTAAKETT